LPRTTRLQTAARIVVRSFVDPHTSDRRDAHSAENTIWTSASNCQKLDRRLLQLVSDAPTPNFPNSIRNLVIRFSLSQSRL